MPEPDAVELEALLARIKSRAATGAFRVTQHAQREMVEAHVSNFNFISESSGRRHHQYL
jgi:hypothetical protein